MKGRVLLISEPSNFDVVSFLTTSLKCRSQIMGRDAHNTLSLLKIRLANGGSYSPFYWDVTAVVNAKREFKELRAYLVNKFPYLKANAGWILHDENDYVSPCIAWPLRTHSFSPSYLPAELVFSARTYVVLLSHNELAWAMPLLSSSIVDYLLKLSLGRMGHPEFVTSVVRMLPWPEVNPSARESLREFGHVAWSRKRKLDTANLISHAFLASALARANTNLRDGVTAWTSLLSETDTTLTEIHRKIDDIAFGLYGISEETRRVIERVRHEEEATSQETHSKEDFEMDTREPPHVADVPSLVSELLDYAVGAAFGRWDIRYATDEQHPPPEPDPFDPVPVCPPGMLQNGQGLPISKDEGIKLTEQGKYPLHVSWWGILADDYAHQEDIVNRVQEVLHVIWGERK